MIEASTAFINALKSPTKEFFIKMELYNKSMVFIEEVTRQVISSDLGSISVDSSRPIRRSFTFSLDNDKGNFTWGEDKLIWIDKRIKLFTGLKLPNGNIEYVQQGVFIVSEPQDSHDMNGKRVTITGQDKAFLMTDKRGKFLNQTTIATGTNIGAAIKTIAQGAGETLFNFDDITAITPYELTYESGDNRWNAIQELASFAICDVFYDVYGYLRLRKINLNEFEQYPVQWTYQYGDRFYAGNVRKMDETELANAIRVVGGSSQTQTVTYDLIVDETNPLWVNNPYSVQKIGYILYLHNNGDPDPLIANKDIDAKNRAKFELRKRLGFTEQLELQIAPNWLCDGNDIISVIDDNNGVTGKYLVTSFQLPLNPQLMTISCLKYRTVITDWNFI